MSDLIQSLFGGGSGSGDLSSGFSVSGGGENAPFLMGPTLFDLGQIAQSLFTNEHAVGNRYGQLGLGGSTMQHQDEAGAQGLATALTGQEQTADVGNPALNPALQKPINQLNTGTQGQSGGSGDSNALGTAIGVGADLLGAFL